MDSIKIALALNQVSQNEDAVRNSVQLFWALFDSEPPQPDKLQEAANLQVDYLEGLRRRGNSITSAELTALAVLMPDAVSGILPERLRELAAQITPSPAPDGTVDRDALVVAMHLEASSMELCRQSGHIEDLSLHARRLENLVTWLKAQTHPSSDTPGTVQIRLNANSASPWTERVAERDWPFVQARWGVESLLAYVNSKLAAEDGNYAEALNGVRLSLNLIQALNVLRFRLVDEELIDFWFPWDFSDDIWLAPWLSELDLPAQTVAGWFEILKERPRLDTPSGWSALAVTLDTLSTMAEDFGRDEDIADGDGHTWDWYTYWQRAASVAEDRLSPNELRDLLQDREDIAAEARLLAYFFTADQWEALPVRARGALVAADRAWVSSTYKAQVLNSLRVAAEDILYHGLWTDLLEWSEGQASLDLQRLGKVKLHLGDDEPGLAQYEYVLLDKGVERYLRETRGLETVDIKVIRGAARQFKRLRKSRNVAEHKPNAAVATGRIRDLYARFVGIGTKDSGILPELVRLLLQPRPMS